jgi:hypothetical protein
VCVCVCVYADSSKNLSQLQVIDYPRVNLVSVFLHNIEYSILKHTKKFLCFTENVATSGKSLIICYHSFSIVYFILYF